MCVYSSFPICDVSEYMALQPLGFENLRYCFDFCDSIQCKMLGTQCLHIKQCAFVTYWQMPFIVHTTDKVTMGVNANLIGRSQINFICTKEMIQSKQPKLYKNVPIRSL